MLLMTLAVKRYIGVYKNNLIICTPDIRMWLIENTKTT